jgi:4-amino-4-deoxy-L-arabinose transferase-like glycosyltransferase
MATETLAPRTPASRIRLGLWAPALIAIALEVVVGLRMVAFIDEPMFTDPAAQFAQGTGFASPFMRALPGGDIGVWWLPPLHTMLVGGVTAITGVSLFAARLPSILAAGLLAALLAHWVRERHGARWQWLAVVALLSSPFFVLSGAIARMDILAVAFSVLAIMKGTEAMRDGASATRNAKLLAAGASFLAVLSHPYGVIPTLTLAVVMVARRGRGFTVVAYLATGVVAALVFWALTAIGHLDVMVDQLRLQAQRKGQTAFASILSVNRNHLPLLALGPLLVLARRRWSLEAFVWLVWWAFAFAFMTVGGEIAYPLYVVPPAVLLLVEGLTDWHVAGSSRRWVPIGALAVAALLIVAEAGNTAKTQHERWIDQDAVVAQFRSAIPRGSRVVITGESLSPEAYFALRGRADLIQEIPVPIDPAVRRRTIDTSDFLIGAVPPTVDADLTQVGEVQAGGTTTGIFRPR